MARLYILAIVTAIALLVVLATGAAATSLHDHPEQQNFISIHQTATWAATGLSLILAVLLVSTSAGTWRIVAIALALAAGAVDGYLGTSAVLRSSPFVIGTIHAWLAAIAFAPIGALAWSLSPAYARGPEQVRDFGWPSLRFLTAAAVFCLAGQIELGAGYRHSTLSIIPHLLAAPAATLVAIIAGSFVLQQFPKHPSLRPTGIALVIITSLQVALGITAFVIGLTQRVLTPAFLSFRVAHVVTGSITLAVCLILAVEVRRKVLPKLAQPDPAQPDAV